jgi:hypothetical protein
MINIKIPGKYKNEPPIVTDIITTIVNTEEPKTSNMSLSIRDEAIRRDTIVKKLFAACPYKAGDTVIPKTAEGIMEYGDKIFVRGVASSYTQMSKEEKWPASDNPLIVLAYSHKKDEAFFCTVNFLAKKVIE